MASPRIQQKPHLLVSRASLKEAALRLLAAERSEEIYPILLEEIVNLGFARALVLEVNFDTGEIKPTASLNCEKTYLERFHTSLWASESPIIPVLQNLTPTVLPFGPNRADSFYAYPMIYRSKTRCWEAERERRKDCLAIHN